VVYSLEHTISLVRAESKSEAFDIFAKNLIEDKNLNIFIKNFALGDGLLSSFYHDDQGDLSDENEYPEHLKQLNEQERDKYINACIESNVRQFWDDEPQFASEFLQAVETAKRKGISEASHFSDAFLMSTIKKVIQKGDWFETFDIVKIDLTDTDYQIIYGEGS